MIVYNKLYDLRFGQTCMYNVMWWLMMIGNNFETTNTNMTSGNGNWNLFQYKTHFEEWIVKRHWRVEPINQSTMNVKTE